MSQIQPTIEVSDLYVAAFALLKARLAKTRLDGKRTIFVFHNIDGRAEQATVDYVNGPAVQLKEYLQALKELKTIAFGNRRVPADLPTR